MLTNQLGTLNIYDCQEEHVQNLVKDIYFCLDVTLI